MTWWQLVVAIVAGLLIVWLTLIAALWLSQRRHSDPISWRESMRVLPDVVLLVKRLAGDGELPKGVRIRLYILVGYLVLPIDLVPDFIPVLGYADDAIIVALVLRSVVRAAGATAIERHWPGSAKGLVVVQRLAGLSPAGGPRT